MENQRQERGTEYSVIHTLRTVAPSATLPILILEDAGD